MIYRGVVAAFNSRDPNTLIQVVVPQVTGTRSQTARNAITDLKTSDPVWVAYESGDFSKPVVISRATAAASSPLTIEQSQVTGLVSDLAAKAPSASPTLTGTVTLPSTTSIGSVTGTELGYLGGVTSAIQTQFAGKVSGPGSATDNAIARFDATTGKLVQNSGVIVDDSNNVTGIAKITSSDAKVLSPTWSGRKTAGTQALTNGSWTTVVFDTVDANVGSPYSGGVFTAPRDGMYLLSAYIVTDFSTAGTNLVQWLDTTNSKILGMEQGVSVFVWQGTITVCTFLASGVTCEVQWFTNSGTGKNIDVDSRASFTYLGAPT